MSNIKKEKWVCKACDHSCTITINKNQNESTFSDFQFCVCRKTRPEWKLIKEDLNFSWVCNECNSSELTSCILEVDLHYYACTECGCNEFHKEYHA